MAILFGVCFALFLCFYEETKFVDCITGLAPADLTQQPVSVFSPRGEKEDRKMKEHINTEFDGITCMRFGSTAPEIDLSIPRKTYLEKLSLWSPSPGSFKFFVRHTYQPLVVTFTFPAAFYVSVVYGALTATWQVMITVVASVMPEPPYNFNASQVGLMTLAPFIGTTIGSLLVAPVSDRLVLRLAKRNGGLFEPEMRLWILLVFAPLVPTGILLFGYSLGNSKPWYIVAIGYAIFGLAMGPVSSASLTYLTDAYTNVSDSETSTEIGIWLSNILMCV
jgi:MFS family permease